MHLEKDLYPVTKNAGKTYVTLLAASIIVPITMAVLHPYILDGEEFRGNTLILMTPCFLVNICATIIMARLKITLEGSLFILAGLMILSAAAFALGANLSSRPIFTFFCVLFSLSSYIALLSIFFAFSRKPDTQ